MKTLRTDGEMQGETGVDLVPTVDDFTDLVGKILYERLVNATRGEIDDKYFQGIWMDAWDGLFYYSAIGISSKLAEDERTALLPEYAKKLRFIDGLRVFVDSGRVHLHFPEKGAITLPITSFEEPLNEITIKELHEIIDLPSIDRMIKWLQEEGGTAELHKKNFHILQYDAFISHSSRDAFFAREVHDFLINKGKKVFISELSLSALGKADYMKAIDDALDQSKHMVLVGSSIENLTSGLVEAEWRVFINEIRSGRKQGNFVTVISSDMQPSSLPLSVRYYEVIQRSEDFLDRVLKYMN